MQIVTILDAPAIAVSGPRRYRAVLSQDFGLVQKSYQKNVLENRPFLIFAP
jgi:hypothetical protein